MARPRPRGFALIVVLWIAAFLGALALTVTQLVRTETGLIRNAEREARAGHTARAVLNTTLLELLEPGREIPLDGSVYRVRWQDEIVPVHIEHEGGKININAAGEAVIVAVLSVLGLDAERLAARILDWRDADDRLRGQGAEAEDYTRAGLTFQPANRPFAAIDELEQVWGVDRSMARALARVFTTRGGGTVTLRHAPEPIRVAMDQLSAADRGRLVRAPSSETTPVAVSGPLTIRIPIDAGGPVPLTFEARVTLAPGLARPILMRDWRQVYPAAPS